MAAKKYVTLKWKDVEKDVAKLCGQIRGSGYKFDAILGIARGGLVPAMLLSDELDQHNLATIHMQLYKSGKKLEKLEILDWPAKPLEGKRILVVDDISDTGETLSQLKEWLSKQKIAEFRIACLHSKARTSLKPDFYSRELEGWVCYPWNRREDMRALENR
ncbi:MAG: phosphoribosyltransferase [Candidatus Micrarchaeota archaeon]